MSATSGQPDRDDDKAASCEQLAQAAFAKRIAGLGLKSSQIGIRLDGPKGVLPVEAIRAAREHRELIIPRLVKLVQQATEAARDDGPPESNGHFFALFLRMLCDGEQISVVS